jgi:predicted nucleotidyltransferase
MTSKTGLGIEDLLQEQRSQILAIAQKHGAYNVRVFGSVARGEATEQSDIAEGVTNKLKACLIRLSTPLTYEKISAY